MTKPLQSIASATQRLWARFNDYVSAHNDRKIAAWGSALQYKRAYTNPDAAKRFRKAV